RNCGSPQEKELWLRHKRRNCGFATGEGTVASPEGPGTVASPQGPGTVASPQGPGTVASPQGPGTVASPQGPGTEASAPGQGSGRRPVQLRVKPSISREAQSRVLGGGSGGGSPWESAGSSLA